MTSGNPIMVSGGRLRDEALVFIGETSKAAQSFGRGVQKATGTYRGSLRAARQRFVGSAKGSAVQLRGAVEAEADFWRKLVIKTRAAYVGELHKRFDEVESGVTDARDALRPDALRLRALETAHELLESAQSVVDEQLADVTTPKKPAPKAPPKRTPRKATPASRKADGDAPIRNYDNLTAKDVVARIQRLSPPQASALLDYEQGRKNRATVIRAAKQRAAAG